MCQLKESKIIVEGAFARVLELMWPSSLNLFTCLAISHVESGAGVQFTILHILQLSVPCQICVKTKCPSLKMFICHPRPAPLSPTLVQKQLNSCAKSEQQTFYLPGLLLIYVTLQMASFMSLPIKVLFRQDTFRRERAAPNAKSVKFLARKCEFVTW